MLVFRRGNEIPELGSEINRREQFSVCGKLLGNYPIAGWLQTAGSFIKRRAEGVRWSGNVGEKTSAMMQEVLENPVRGNCYVPKLKNGIVWCDFSSIATGSCPGN